MLYCINTQQSPSGSKVPMLNMCRSISSSSKIAHQMWHDHPFSQRNRTTEIPVGMGVGDDRKVGEGWTKFENGER